MGQHKALLIQPETNDLNSLTRLSEGHSTSAELAYSAAILTHKQQSYILFVHNGRPRLFILALCNIHILSGGETCHNGPPQSMHSVGALVLQ